MKTLIAPAKVIELAFADGGYIPPELITEADILTAQVRHILPVVGEKLFQRLLEGAYPDFASAYIAPALALHTRLAIQPRIDIRCAAGGSVAPRSSGYQPASEASLRELRGSLRRQARSLLRRASDMLDSHQDDFAEYDPAANILKRCLTDGGFVQIP